MPDFHTEVGGAIDATHTYYNIVVKNDNAVSQVAVPLVFNESREVPILVNPSEHFMSVMRFTLETSTLPVFIPIPLSGSVIVQGSPIETIYTISLKDSTGTIATRNVLWVPEDLTFPQPEGKVTQQMYNNPYFYCYSYQHFINLINNTLVALQADLGLISVPSLFYDTKTNLISVVAIETDWRTQIDGTLMGTQGTLYFNSALFNLTSALSSIYVANTLGNDIDYQIVFSTGTNATLPPYPFVLNTYVNLLDNAVYIRNVEDYPTIALWTPVRSVIFKSSLLTSVAELQGVPQVYGYTKTSILSPYPLYSPTTQYGIGCSVTLNNANYRLNYILLTAPTPAVGSDWSKFTIPYYSPYDSYKLNTFVTYGGNIYQLQSPYVTPSTQPIPGLANITNPWVVAAVPAYSNVALYTLGNNSLSPSIVSSGGFNWIITYQATEAVQPSPIGNPNWSLFQNTVLSDYNPSNADVLNVLIEHSVELVNGTEYKPYIYYEPTGEYRLTDLYGQMPINQIQLEGLWKDSFGNLNPIYLPVGSSASIKILFRKKNFNSDLL